MGTARQLAKARAAASKSGAGTEPGYSRAGGYATGGRARADSRAAVGARSTIRIAPCGGSATPSAGGFSTWPGDFDGGALAGHGTIQRHGYADHGAAAAAKGLAGIASGPGRIGRGPGVARGPGG